MTPLSNRRMEPGDFDDLSPEGLAEGQRREEALRNEREVQERAKAYAQVEGLGERKAARDRAVAALAAEVGRRNEFYGLDNWTFEEVVDFVLNHAHERYEVD